jgi:drug/metabolite transporter (DMT)-like permease
MNGTVVFGLLSALSWGAGDFCGGLAARRSSLLSVIVCSQVAGVIVLSLIAWLVAEPVPSMNILLVGGAAGILGDIGLLSLYYALSRGKMGVAAPVSGVVAAMMPVLFGAVMEGLPGALQVAGFVLALLGIWLVARSEYSAMRLADLGMPIVAGIGFGLFFIVIDQVSKVSVFWPLVAARVASITLLVVAGLVLRHPLLPVRGQLPLVVGSGALDAGGNVFFALAALAGRLDIAAVLSSLYPATTVVLAGFFLRERLSRPQTFGVVATLVAIALIVL